MNQIEHERALALYQRLLEAWNRRDADGFASLFTTDGNTVGFDGSPLDGREDLASSLRSIFADHVTATYVAKIREVRALGPGVTLVRAVVGMVPPGKTELNPATNAIQSIVVVDDGAEPRVALLQNTPAAFHGRPALASELTKELTGALSSGRTVTRG
jgi:uncharacterized protein (TIGR02246 family)